MLIRYPLILTAIRNIFAPQLNIRWMEWVMSTSFLSYLMLERVEQGILE